MAIKPKKESAPEAKEFPRKAVPLYLMKGDSAEVAARKMAALATSPELAAYRVINGAERLTGIGDEVDVPSLLAQLRDQADAANRGDLSQAEAMLMNQAIALQSLFARLAERGMGCDNAPAFEANMRMALRAQSQCRATLETLAEIKNPMAGAYVRQANIAAGHQQVNNGATPEGKPRARENKSEQSKQLEEKTHERMDTRAAETAGGINPTMEAVGEINRPANTRR